MYGIDIGHKGLMPYITLDLVLLKGTEMLGWDLFLHSNA